MNLKQFLFGGNAYLTVVLDGEHKTYRVSANDTGKVYFVSMLVGEDSTTQYVYLGTIFDKARFTTTRKSRLDRDSMPVQIFEWIFACAYAEAPYSDSPWGPLEILPAENCGKCGKMLTTPESIARGFGPECWSIVRGGHNA